MRCACVDIGSNTTRVLVADVSQSGLAEVICEKAYTRLGSVLRRTGSLPEEALDAVSDTVAVQVAVARSLGAERLRVVATAAIRAARNAEALVAAVRRRAGVEVDVLDGDAEARLAFAGATHGTDHRGAVAVVDVGGGSTEIAVGTTTGGAEWAASLPLGSSSLTDEGGDLAAIARAALGTLRPPPADVALAVGGSAAAVLAGTSSGLSPEQAQLLPAAIALLTAASELIGQPLQLGAGGLREGVVLALGGFTSDGYRSSA